MRPRRRGFILMQESDSQEAPSDRTQSSELGPGTVCTPSWRRAGSAMLQSLGPCAPAEEPGLRRAPARRGAAFSARLRWQVSTTAEPGLQELRPATPQCAARLLADPGLPRSSGQSRLRRRWRGGRRGRRWFGPGARGARVSRPGPEGHARFDVGPEVGLRRVKRPLGPGRPGSHFQVGPG